MAEEAEYGGLPTDEDDEDIELIDQSGGPGLPRRGASSRTRRLSSDYSDGGEASASATCRVVTVLFLLALAGVYQLGVKEGKVEVRTGKHVAGASDRPHKVFGGGGDAAGPAPAPEEEKETGAFTPRHLEAMRGECNKLLETLDEYYYGRDQAEKMLMQAFMAPWDFDGPEDSEDRRRSDKLVDTMARAIVTDDQRQFLMGGIGSSVMAGHDNCHYDSYQTQMERFFQPVWEAADMEFVFQNAGEGGGCGDSYENQHYCVRQNVSPNVDIVHYSWTYFEHGGAHKEHENLVRWTQMLPKQPPVHIFNTGKVPGGNGQDRQLMTQYADYGFNAFYMQTGFYNGGHPYDSEKSQGTDRFSWGYVGDGYHETTRYGEDEEDEARKTSLGVVMRNWHPGPMGFQLTSDAFTYTYTRAILRALELIEKDFDEEKDPRDKWDASERELLLKNDLPEPKYCDSDICVVDEPPGCLNYELPTYGYWGARVEDPTDDLNPYLGETQKWSVWHENNSLWNMVGKQDTAVFKNRDDKELCRHLDACGGISAQKAEDGMVVFRLPKMEVGLIIICGCCGKNVADDLFLNNMDIEISYNTVVQDRANWDKFPNGKCVRLLKKFPTSGRESETPTGHAYLGVKVLRDMKQPVRISHVITL